MRVNRENILDLTNIHEREYAAAMIRKVDFLNSLKRNILKGKIL